MNWLKFLFQLNEDAPGQITGSPGSGKETMTAEDDLKFLREGEQDDKGSGEEENESDQPGKKDSKGKSEESEESESEESEESNKEEVEGKEEDEEEEEEEEEIIGSLVTAKDVKEKYPDIFKKIPELKAVIYREQQYSQLFANPQEAQDAAGLADTFREMESDIVKGDFEPLLSAVKNTKDADFNKLAANLLPSMRKLDEQTYMKMLAVPLKQVLRSATAEAKQKGNKNLEYAAQYIHDFIFNDTNINDKAEFETNETKANPEEEKYKKKLEELDARDHNNFKNVVDREWLTEVQEVFFDKFDPDNVLSKWTKDKMFEDAVRELNKQLVADPRHMKNMEGLWRQAKASGYNADSKARIVNAALARAKQIIPTVRQKLRSEAFAKSDKTENKDEKRTFKPRNERSGNNGNEKRERKSPRNTSDMSDLDIIRGA